MMGRVAWLPIILILLVRCQGLDITTSERPAHLSGVKDQTFDGNITSATFLTSFLHSFKQTLDNLDNIIKAQLQFQDGIKEKLTLHQTFLNNEIELHKSRLEDKIVQLKKAFNDKIHTLEKKMRDRFKSLDAKPQAFWRAPCHRGMSDDTTKDYQALELMRDYTLNRVILCDTKTDGGGWIVFQRRTKGDVDFYKTWEEYKDGFGSPPGDFWLGNEAIHDLTSKDSYELRVEFNNGSHDQLFVYSSFRLESEADNYRLRLGPRSGYNAETYTFFDLSFNNGSQFGTHDKDESEQNCAEMGAWWHGEEICTAINLNGKWGETSYDGMWWHAGSWLKSSEMKIRLK